VPQHTEPEFIRQQFEFTAHIRDPENAPAPSGIEARRLKIYTDLFYNNIEGFVSGSFPVLRSITNDDNWHKMVRSFFVEHRCHSPYFLEISKEFLSWFQDNTDKLIDAPAFSAELTHYEWVELALSVSDADSDLKELNHNGDIIQNTPIISPLAWHLSYQYPVHLISDKHRPEAKETYLVVYRDRQNEIHFLELNPVTYRLLDILKENPEMTGLKAVEQIAVELQHPEPQVVIDHGKELLFDLRKRNIIVGTTD